jgi:uncharacterized protein
MAVPMGAVQRDGNTAAFLDGTARGEFLLRRCRRCGTVGGPQEAQCGQCGSTETQWFPASGDARVVSWSVVHGKGPDGTSGPQAVIVVGELTEGPWWWTQILDAEPAQMATGRRLRVGFEPAVGGEYLPVFRLAS